MTTNGRGLIPFKKGPFEIRAPVKLTHLKYASNNFFPCLNFLFISDCIILNFMNLKMSLEYTEIEGCLRPRVVKDWKEYAEETRKLMANQFRMKLYEGNIKDKIQYSKEVSPLNYKF